MFSVVECSLGGHGDVHDQSSIMGENDEHEAQAECDRPHDEEVGRYDLARIIGEECARHDCEGDVWSRRMYVATGSVSGALV